MSSRPESVTREMERVVNEKREAMLKFAKMRGVQPLVEAEDCVSLATVRFFKNFDHSLGNMPVTYLYTVMKSVIREWHRDQVPFTRVSGTQKIVPVSGLTDDAIDNLAANCFDPFRCFDSNDAAVEKLARLLRRLSPNQRLVLGHMLSGLPVAQTAGALKVGVGRVQQLRKAVREHAIECGVCS